MKELIDFFIEVGKLKTLKRRGWLMRDLKDPETVADHAYRVLFLAWIFSKGHNLNTKKVLKLALIHSLSAVHIDYVSPYDKLLEAKSHSEAQRRYPALVLRAPLQVKGVIKNKRFQEEKRAIEKLIKYLPETLSKEVLDLWMDFQTSSSKEAKFLRAVDKLENLIQAIEYRKQLKKSFMAPFWSQMSEVTDDPKLLHLVEGLDQYVKKGSAQKRSTQKMLDFIFIIGKMKKIKRKGWLIRGVKKPESLAAHSFRSAFMSWVLSRNKRMDREIVLVISFIHDLFAPLIGDITPYEKILEDAKDKKKLLENLPWIGSSRGKKVLMLEQIEKELEYKTGVSKEARFVRQVDRIEGVIQAMEYQKKDKSIPVKAFWLELKELIDDSVLAEFVDQLDYQLLQSGK
jgi:putative hydrolase of HD superfamily